MLLAQGFTAGAKNARAYTKGDFFPSLDEAERRPIPASPRERARQMRGTLEEVAALFGGTVTHTKLDPSEIAERWE